MKRTSTKRAPPKRQQGKPGAPSNKRAPASKAKAQAKVSEKAADICGHCENALGSAERALYVEEEVGRTFCSEDCIAAFFAPDIQRLEKDYFKHLPDDELSEDDREKHSHLRWQTIQEPQEIWREKTLNGDHRYTLISEYRVKNKTLWSVCICLLLRGEPSFLYLAFVSRKPEFIDRYRRGERVQRVKATKSQAAGEDQAVVGEGAEAEDADDEAPKPMMDGLAEPWTEDELLIAERARLMKDTDIASDTYTQYEHCVEATLEKPTEVWGWESKDGGETPQKYYHFIRHYDDKSPFWYIIVAKETDQEDQLEIVDLFPTRDEDLVSRYRRGEQEMGESEEQQPVVSRLVH